MSVAPVMGVLRGNESTQVVWSFIPGKQKTYDVKVPCLLYDPDDNEAAEAALLPLSTPATASLQSTTRADGAADDPEGKADNADVEGGEEALEVGNPETEEKLDGEEARSKLSLPSRPPPPSLPPLPPGMDRVVLKVLGEGTAGALAMDPPSLELGTLLVGHAVTRPVTLFNQSDGVIRYRIDCGPADGNPEREAGSTPVEFPQAGLSAVDPIPGLEVWVDESEGAIPARASKIVNVTFFPRFRKQYKLQLRCRTATVPPLLTPPSAPPAHRVPSGGSLRPSSLPPLLTKQRSRNNSNGSPIAVGNLTLAAATSLGGLGEDTAPAVDKWPQQPSSAPPAICSLSATTVFPRLMVTDVLLEGVPKHVVWDMMGVQEVNAELKTQVTDLELELNKVSALALWILWRDGLMRAGQYLSH